MFLELNRTLSKYQEVPTCVRGAVPVLLFFFLSVRLPSAVYSTPGYMKALRSTEREVDETLRLLKI